MTRDETRRLREAFATISPGDKPSGACPPAERIWEAVRDELSPAETRSILEHVAACPVCTEAWRLASHLEEGDQLLAAHSAPARSGRAAWLGVGGAVAALFAYLLVGVSTRDLPSGGSIARSIETPPIASTGETSLPRTDCRLTWTAIDGALYDVEVSDQSLELIATETGLDSPAIRIHESALPTPARLLVNVRAYQALDGAPIAERTLEFECTE